MKDDEKIVKKSDQLLVEFVTGHCEQWQDNIESNYYELWDEYERLWLGVFFEGDRTRKSERSRLITPALQQAVETYQAEIEEAVFGRGQYFDIIDDAKDEVKLDVEQLKTQLHEDFSQDKIQTSISQVIALGAVFGTGIGEIHVKTKKEYNPRSEVTGGIRIGGVQETDRFCVYLKPIHPKNFIIDPNANTLEEAMGCAVQEFVSIHSIKQKQKEGVYRDVSIGTDAIDDDLVPFSQTEDVYMDNKVRLLKYYGLVPRAYIEGVKEEDGEKEKSSEKQLEEALGMDEMTDKDEMYEDLVEAIVVIANDGTLLKAEVTPYMMQDRPIVYFSPEPLPGRFWGRGIAQKGFNMQKAVDAQIRSHLDRLALTTAPMVKADATRLPRGFKFEVHPGRMLLTNGDPNAIQEFNFGAPDAQNVETAKMFERMLLQATGTLDAAGMPSDISGASQSGALSLAMSGIIKKNKRGLLNFQDNFLIPFIKKAAWRYMQFDPDRYAVKDYKFIPVSSLGIMAREFEQQQYMAMLATLGPDSPIVPLVLQAIVDNSSLSNREELKEALIKMSQPDPQEQQMAQQAQMLAMMEVEAKIEQAKAAAEQSRAMAIKTITEAQAIPDELKIKLIQAVGTGADTGSEFDQRAKFAELMLKEKDLELKEMDIISNERIAEIQQSASLATKAAEMDEKEKDRELKREEIKAKKAEKSITRTKDGYSVKSKD
jgi:hypothetical protein